ncbi:MAG: substrate-binding domain-containing protein [Pirellulales bacterium]|nr:substrate-binding domain-containing protein [Pirellulales bacterium]
MYESPWHGRHVPEWDEDQERLAEWVHSLTMPAGIMCCNDVRGQQVLDACHRVHIAVPEEIAVVGVDNEKVLCKLCDPPLSSVAPNPERIGYEAAELLDQLISGKSPGSEERLIPPLYVVTRQSSDTLGIDDTDVASALRFIRENACVGATVEDVVRHVAISRSQLERRFRKYLNHSPHTEIRIVQVKRVKELLMDTDLSLSAIARQAGYVHSEYMSVVFKRLTGQTPGEFRRGNVS